MMKENNVCRHRADLAAFSCFSGFCELELLHLHSNFVPRSQMCSQQTTGLRAQF